MPEQIAIIDVIVPPPPVIDVAAIGVQGPPGAPGEDGAPGPPGPAGPQGPAGTAGIHASTHYVGGSDALAGSLAATDVRVGVNPSVTGEVRLSNVGGNTGMLTSRNAAGTDDIQMIRTYVDDKVYVGSDVGAGQGLVLRSPTTIDATKQINAPTLALGTNPAQSGAIRIPNNQYLTTRNAANTADVQCIAVDGADNLNLGIGAGSVQITAYTNIANSCTVASHLFLGGIVSLTETGGAGAPGANGAFLWLEDNGAGKSRLMVQFATGAAIQLAIQP